MEQGQDSLDERIVRLSVNLHSDVARVLQGHAELAGISVTEAVRRAVAVWAFIEDAKRAGDTVAVVQRSPGGAATVREVVTVE